MKVVIALGEQLHGHKHRWVDEPINQSDIFQWPRGSSLRGGVERQPESQPTAPIWMHDGIGEVRRPSSTAGEGRKHHLQQIEGTRIQERKPVLIALRSRQTWFVVIGSGLVVAVTQVMAKIFGWS